MLRGHADELVEGGGLFRRGILRLLIGIYVAVALASCVWAQQSYEVIAQNGVSMKTRDGVTLYADIYRPKADGKFPVILMRTPYDKSVSWAVSPAYQIVEHGYVVVVQDVRGRYTSEGEWYPFRHESADGYDTVEWVAALPYADGRVGMMGGSYVGATQMLTAIAYPPHLAGICPGGNGEQLSRELDVSRRGSRTVVRPKLDDAVGHEHALAIDCEKHRRAGGRADSTAHAVSRVQLRGPSRWGGRHGRTRAVLSRLASASCLRFVLEAVVHRGAFFGY